MESEFGKLYKQYELFFKVRPPVHDGGVYPTAAQAKAMLELALSRGTPIVDNDYPPLGDTVI